MRARSRLAPGLRRVRRLKLLTAILLLATTAVGLLLFGVAVAASDAELERDRVDRLLQRQVEAAVSRVSLDGDGGVVVKFAEDKTLAGGYPQLYVVELGSVALPPARGTSPEAQVVFSPRTPFWPDAAVVEAAESFGGPTGDLEPRIVRDVAERIYPYERLQQLRMLVAPVVDGDGKMRAAVVGVATTSSGDASHARLVGMMWWSAGSVLLFGLIVAVALARGRFWLVDRALERHEQFLHDTAHELRAPITSLRAITEAGLAGDEEPRQALARVMQVVHSTDRVIDDLMTLTRIETGRELLEVERLRLDVLVETLVDQRVDVPPVQLDLEPVVVDANPELVRRAVENLVENAVRHGRADDPGAEVTVSVRPGKVTVADRGAGVAPQILTHVLERTRGGRRRTGSGLGLAIAGWVARIHGGQLEASNRPDRGGAVFTLTLPHRAGGRPRRPRRQSDRGLPGDQPDGDAGA